MTIPVASQLSRNRSVRGLLVALLFLATAATLIGQQPATSTPAPITAERLERPAPGEWLQSGRDYANQRYSPLTQITPRNVARLAPRSVLQLELPQAGAGAEATPIVA